MPARKRLGHEVPGSIFRHSGMERTYLIQIIAGVAP